MSSMLENEIKQLRAESSRHNKAQGLKGKKQEQRAPGLKRNENNSGLNKAQSVKKEKARKASSGFENEIKQLRAESSRLNKAQGLKGKK